MDKTHKTLLILGDIAALAASAYILYRLLDNDAVIKTFKLKAMRSTSRMAKIQADWWSKLAADADTAYFRINDVTV